MIRVDGLSVRGDLRRTFEELRHHSYDHEKPYWQDTVAYQFTENEIDALKVAASEIQGLSQEAIQRVIDHDLFNKFGIPQEWAGYIATTWERRDPTIGGRLDFAYNGEGSTPKLLEYNAEYLGDIVETSVVQAHWAKDRGVKQFNNLEADYIKVWKRAQERLGIPQPFYFAGILDNPDSFDTTEFLLYTCLEAGIDADAIDVGNIGWDGRSFTNLEGRPIKGFYKDYPWRAVVNDEYGDYILRDETAVMDPAWTMILTSKALMPLLWEMAPNHPNLLPSFYDAASLEGKSYVKKPILGYGGNSVEIVDAEDGMKRGGDCGKEGFIFQEYHRLNSFDGNFPVCGLWVSNDTPSALSVREDKSRVTGSKDCKFAPHMII